MAIAAVSEIRMGQVIPCLKMAHAAGPQAVMLWGPPGTAKSALIKEYARLSGIAFVDVRLPLFDPVDLKGIPGLVEATVTLADGTQEATKVTRFYAPDFLPRQECVILFDELANALPATQTACQRIVLDRSSDGGWVAHPRTLICAASNRRTDRCGVNSMPASLDNRLVHLEVKPDVSFWTSWLLSTYSTTQAERDASAVIVSYLSWRGDHAYKFDADAVQKGNHGCPTFRSWESVGKLLIAGYESWSGEVLHAMIKGTIGVGVGTEFVTFLRLKDKLPDIDGILAGKPWTVPDAPDVRYAFIGAVAGRVTAKTNAAVWKIVERLDEAKAAEFAVCLVRMAMKQHKPFAASKEFVTWAQKHKALVGCA